MLDASGPVRSVASGFCGVRPVGPEWHAVWSIRPRRLPVSATGPEPLLVERQPGDTAWLWSVPLAGGDRAELGCLVPAGSVGGPGRAAEQVLRAELDRSRWLRGELGDGRLTGSVHGVRSREQVAERVHGPGWASVGDASCVLHPLLGGGTTLAMLTAAPLAQAVDIVLRGDAQRTRPWSVTPVAAAAWSVMLPHTCAPSDGPTSVPGSVPRTRGPSDRVHPAPGSTPCCAGWSASGRLPHRMPRTRRRALKNR